MIFCMSQTTSDNNIANNTLDCKYRVILLNYLNLLKVKFNLLTLKYLKIKRLTGK